MVIRIAAAFFISLSHAQGEGQVVDRTLKCANNASYPVHLTFDDGPRIPETEIIMDILKKHGIKATFFVTTSRFPKLAAGRTPYSPHDDESKMIAIVERMRREGHTVGTHSYKHGKFADPREVAPAEAVRDIQKNSVVAKALKIPPPIPYRFPYGSGWFMDRNPAHQAQADFVMQHIRENNYEPVHWDIDSWDWSKIKRKALPESILRQICSHGGGVVLMHDIQRFTAENLDAVILSIKKSNHRFAGLSEMRSMNLTSFKDRAVAAGYCGKSAGGVDSVWPDCEVYSERSSDAGIRKNGVAR